jgi:hypothetical protein
VALADSLFGDQVDCEHSQLSLLVGVQAEVVWFLFPSSVSFNETVVLSLFLVLSAEVPFKICCHHPWTTTALVDSADSFQVDARQPVRVAIAIIVNDK